MIRGHPEVRLTDGLCVRSSQGKAGIYSTSLIAEIVVVKTNGRNTRVKPVLLGTDRSPPTQSHFSVDETYGLNLMEQSSMVSAVNLNSDPLEPAKYGLDFWRSLGEWNPMLSTVDLS